MLDKHFPSSPFSSLFLLSFGLLLLNSCSNSENEAQKKQFTSFADSLTLATQKHLVSNLNKAISSEGTPFAVSYCNENALSLTSEMIQENQIYSIERKAELARNPNNKLSDSYDEKVWNDWKKAKKERLKLKTITYSKENTFIFYKPILLGMSTCLQCHGNSDEISSEVSEKLATLYPNDEAINFKLNDLRGFWKVTKKLN